MDGLSKKLMLILIPTVILLVGCIGLLVFLPSGNSSVYLEQISSARKYIESGDYQNAILCYHNAIEEDDTKEDAYLELAKIYYTFNNDRDSALDILRRGLANTKSLKIEDAIKYYENLSGVNVKNLNDTPNEKVSFNGNLVDIFSTYTYEDYSVKYTVKEDNMVSDKYTVSYAQCDASFEYCNSYGTDVIDKDTRKPYLYARPTSIKLNNLSDIIYGVNAGVSVEDLKSCKAENIEILPFNKDLNTYLVTFNYKDMKFTLGCDKNGTVKGEKSYNEIVPKAGEKSDKKVRTTGKIIDVTTGKSVPDVTLVFHKGKDSKNGDVAEKITVKSGDYSIDLAPGDYTVEVTAEGYNKEFINLFVPNGKDKVEQVFSISPTLAANEIRFVLEWGETPHDLDSHLRGRLPDGTNMAVNFNHPSFSSGGEIIADLDIDDTSSFGPETITLYKTNGKFEYRVHRFSHDGDLATSGATVKIYTSSSSNPITVTVPDNVDSQWWTVCTVENGEIKDINGKRS